jgi:MscS family membrane protein
MMVAEIERIAETLPWLKTPYLGIPLGQIIAAATLILAAVLLKRFFEHVFMKWLLRFLGQNLRYDAHVLKAAGRPFAAFVIVTGFFLGIRILIQGTPYQRNPDMPLLTQSYLVAIGLLVIWAFYRGAEVGATVMDDLFTRKNDSIKGQFFPILNRTLKVLVLMIGLLTLAASFGVNVAGLIASLGIGGLAVALAAQDTLGNLFGSIAVLIDRPFKVGDVVRIGDKIEGTVEEIGFRSTKIRSVDHTQLVVPNKTVASEIIDNGSARGKRRVRMTVGITYAALPEDLERLLGRIRALLAADAGVDGEGMLVRFSEFGASSLDILLQYYTKDPQIDAHLAVKERINFGIMREVRACGLSMAFPTRTVELDGKLARALVESKGKDPAARQ